MNKATTPTGVASRICQVLRAKGHSDKWLAQRIGRSRALVNHIIRSRRSYVPHSEKIAEALGVSEGWLSDGTGVPPSVSQGAVSPRRRGRPRTLSYPLELLPIDQQKIVSRVDRFQLSTIEVATMVSALRKSGPSMKDPEACRFLIEKLCSPYGGERAFDITVKMRKEISSKVVSMLNHEFSQQKLAREIDELRPRGN